jgi:membrane-bound metal-dependent hydrolase YbcI (DUF457 family)
MSLAYLLGKGSSRALHTKINIPILLVLSILPDIDIVYDFLTGAQIHRGPTHSVIAAILVFIPVFIYYRKKAIPYFLSLISHALIADFFVGGQLQLLWPISNAEFGFHELGGSYFGIFSGINLILEITLFMVALLVLIKTQDWKVFLGSDTTNLVLIIPIATVLLPSTIGYPFTAPLIFTEPTLAIAHIFFLVLFTIAVLKTLRRLLREGIRQPKHTSDAEAAKVPNRSNAYSLGYAAARCDCSLI